ncbi:hypothetical protein D3C72_1841290 [compost metagenome]
MHVDLAQGGGIQHADAIAHGQALAGDGGLHAFARQRKIPRPLPVAHVFERRPLGHVPFVYAGLADGVEKVTQLAARQRAKGNRGVVGPVGGGAGLRDGLAQRVGQHGSAIDVAQLALVGTESHGGVALHMLDRVIALAHRQVDVGHGHVVLVINELLGATSGPLPVRHLPNRQQRVFGDIGRAPR